MQQPLWNKQPGIDLRSLSLRNGDKYEKLVYMANHYNYNYYYYNHNTTTYYYYSVSATVHDGPWPVFYSFLVL
jgi:hypothetical protein